MPLIQVFVSSTFVDFQAERDTLAGAVREKLNAALRPYGSSVEFIDLRWGVDTTEEAEAEAQRKILNVCLREINRTRPFFVGLLGERYGTVPEHSHARWVADAAGIPHDRSVEGLSVTALEFNHALFWGREDLKEDASAVVLIRERSDLLPDSWRDRDPMAAQRLRDQTTRVASVDSGVVVVRYSPLGMRGPGEIDLDTISADGTVTSFADLAALALEPQLVAHAAQLARQASGRPAVLAVRDRHPLNIGREGFADDLATALTRPYAEKWGVLGPSGVGKSALVVDVEGTLRAGGIAVAVAYVGTDEKSHTNRDIVVDLAAELAGYVTDVVVEPPPASSTEYLEWWSSFLTQMQARLGRITILVDGWNRVSRDDDRHDPGFFAAIPDGISVFVTTASDAQRTALQECGFGFYRLGPLFPVEAAQAARAWSHRSGRTLPDEATSFIGAEARTPLWVRVAVSLLSDLRAEDFQRLASEPNQAWAIRRLLASKASALPASIEGLLRSRLDSLDQRIGRRAADLVLGFIGSSYLPLSVIDLGNRMRGHVEDPLTVAVTARDFLGELLWEANEEGGLRVAYMDVMNVANERTSPEVRAILAQSLWNTGLNDDQARWDLLAQLSLASPGSLVDEAEMMVDVLNNAESIGTSTLLLSVMAAPNVRLLELLRLVEVVHLNERAWESLARAPRAWVDENGGITEAHRDALESAVNDLRRKRRRRWRWFS